MWELTVAYAKQETVDPLKGLGRFLGYGVSGSLVFGFGALLLLLSLLRALQTETGTTFTGNPSGSDGPVQTRPDRVSRSSW